MTMETNVDFVLEKIMQILNSEGQLIHFDKDQLQSVYKGMKLLRRFLKDYSEGKRNEDDDEETIKDVRAKIRDVACKVDDTIDLVLFTADHSRLRFNMSEEIEAMRNDDGILGRISELIDVLEAKGLQIREILSSFFRRIVEGIRCVVDNIKDDIEIIKSRLMGIYDLLPTLSPHLVEKIRLSFDCVREEMDSIKTDVETWFDFDDLLLSSSQMAERDDVIITDKLRKGDDPVSYLYYRITSQYHFLSDRLYGLLKKVDSAAKFLHSDPFAEEMKFIETRTTKYKTSLSCLKGSSFSCEEFHSTYGSIIQEMKSLKAGMEIYERQSGRVCSVEIYKNGLSLLLLSPFLEAVHSDMEFVKTKLEVHGNVREYLELRYTEAEGQGYRYFTELVPKKDEDLFFYLSWKMVKLTDKMFHAFVDFIEEISVPGREDCHLFTSNHVVDLFQKNFESIASFLERIVPVTRKLVICYKRGLKSLMPEKICCSFSRVLEEIESTRTEVMKIYEKMKTCDIKVLPVRKFSSRASLVPARAVAGKETIVGFDDQKMMIKDFLTGEHGNQLNLIQIVGMPGAGKTTLARNVYCDPLIVHYFYIRAWTHVSQVCRKRELLLRILCSAFQLGDKICEMTYEKLAEELYKRLKGKRYLIVLDDIWDIGVWNELKRCFPNDNNGSKIVFTSRLEVIDVAISHHLRFLNEDESWILLQQRIFGRECCPPELLEIGREIAKKCGGLPLAIVVLSGLLTKSEKTQNWWLHVAQSVGSYIARDQEQYMDTLALSYNNLPHHLKACFLYFGVFPKDYEIPAWKLIWLWIAEGFIRQNQHKRLEEVAEDYLVDLTDRNLVIVSKKRSNGGIKSCRVHDLLHDLCLKKALEENFLCHLSNDKHSYSHFPILVRNRSRRICIHSHYYNPPSCLSYWLQVRSFLSFGHLLDNLSIAKGSFFFQCFQLLRILDLSSTKIRSFPVEIENLIYLRYLALHVGGIELFKPSIVNLQSLQTLIVDGEPRSLLVLDDFWKMENLRHLRAKQLIEIPHIPENGFSFVLNKLETIGKLDLRGLNEQVLQKIPHLRKLKCSFIEPWGESHIFPKLNFLLQLETLNVIYSGFKRCPRKLPQAVELPSNLKSITLSNFRLPWEEISTLAMLPNLEILKLSYKAFEGSRWDMGDMEFAKLTYLKLRGLDIKQWIASSSHFPMLQTLVLDDCKQLEEIPSGLGDIYSLEIIQCWNCSASASNSAKQIEKQQLILGYDGLKICIHPCHYEVDESDCDDENDAH